jgi:hypothetical protein
MDERKMSSLAFKRCKDCAGVTGLISADRALIEKAS